MKFEERIAYHDFLLNDESIIVAFVVGMNSEIYYSQHYPHRSFFAFKSELMRGNKIK